MNTNLFSKKMETSNYDYNFNLNLSEFNADEMLQDSSFVAAKEELTQDYVLMQDVLDFQTGKTQTTENVAFYTSTNFKNRLVPFYNKPTKTEVNTQTLPKMRGFVVDTNYTESVRKLSILTAKFTLHHLMQLNESLNTLKNVAPNQNTRNIISNLSTEVFVSSQVVRNIIKQLANNPHTNVANNLEHVENRNFCVELKNSVKHADESLKGLIKLFRLVNIPNISRQIIVLKVVMQNIISTLNGLKNYC